MVECKISIVTDGTKVTVYNASGETTVKDGSLRDATEAIEQCVLVSQYLNGVGNFNPDHTISAMVTNPDLRQKMEKIIADAEKG
jgi:hypothetical protein